MSEIAIVLPKAAVHARGARPVIYGLSGGGSGTSIDATGARLLPTTALPTAEQYRYVALSTDGAIDWTHEREWRWPCRAGPRSDEDGSPPASGSEIPGMALDFSGMGVIVRSRLQADKVLHDVLVHADRESIGSFEFILVVENVPDLTSIVAPDDLDAALSSATIDLRPYFSMKKAERAKLCAEFDACVAKITVKALPSGGRERGACWLWLTDAKHPMTRALLLSNRVHINGEGRYLIPLPVLQTRAPLAEREDVAKRLASELLAAHGLRSTFHSVLNRFGIDDVPNYSEAPITDRLVFNHGASSDDF